MRSGDFFAVFCIESNIGPATRNKEKSHSNPSLNIAVKIWKCVGDNGRKNDHHPNMKKTIFFKSAPKLI